MTDSTFDKFVMELAAKVAGGLEASTSTSSWSPKDIAERSVDTALAIVENVRARAANIDTKETRDA